MRGLKKINEIEEKIKKLQEERNAIKQERLKDMTHMISSIGLEKYEDEVLIGGLLELADKLHKKDKITEDWALKGRKFLRSLPKPLLPQTLKKTP